MMQAIFGPGGIYARTLKNFENRLDVVWRFMKWICGQKKAES